MIKLKTDKTMNNWNHLVVIGFIILSFVLDFVDKADIFYDLVFFKFNTILKLFFLAFTLIYITIHFRKVFSQLRFSLLIIVVISILFLLKSNFSQRYLLEYARYFLVLSSFPVLYHIYISKERSYKMEYYKLFKYFIVVNTLCVFIGMLFDIKVFETYRYDRLGYNGIILSQGMTPFIYTSCTLVFLELKKKKLIFLTLLLSILSGVKSVYLAQFILISLVVINNTMLTRKYKMRALAISTAGFLFILLFLFKSTTFKDVIASDGFWSAVFSYRIDNTIELLNLIHADNYNIFIGATNLVKVRLELQIVDILLFYGLIGCISYILWTYFYYKKLVQTYTSKAFFISIITIAILSGNLLYIPLSFILVTIVLMLFSKTTKITTKQNQLTL